MATFEMTAGSFPAGTTISVFRASALGTLVKTATADSDGGSTITGLNSLTHYIATGASRSVSFTTDAVLEPTRIDMLEYGAEPGVDCSTQVAAAIADARSAHGVNLYFPGSPEHWIFTLTVGAVSAAAGRALWVTGDGGYASVLEPASATSPLIDVKNWGDASGNDFVMEGVGVYVPAARKYSDPVVRATLIRFARIEKVRADANSKTCTVFQFDGAYQFTMRGDEFLNAKYAVPVEIVSNTNLQGGSTPPQMDTITISDTTTSGCCGLILRNAANEFHNLLMPNFKVVGTNYYPLNSPTAQAQVVTTLAAPVLAGAQSISLNAKVNTFTITNVSLASNVATITCTPLYGSEYPGVGTTVTISGTAAAAGAFNGTWTVTQRFATGFKVALTHADVGSTADAGTAVGSGTGTQQLAANDVIAIDCGGYLEINKITAISGSGPYTATLAEPLQFNHFPNPDYATACPVVQGGMPVTLGDNTHDIRWFGHAEGFIYAADVGNTHGVHIEGECSSTYLVRVTGSAQGLTVGPTILFGSAMWNQVLVRPTYAYGTIDRNWHLDGPFTQGGSSYTLTPVLTPTNEAGTTVGTRPWKSSSSTIKPQETWNELAANAIGGTRVQVLNSGNAVQKEYYTGQAWFSDGVGTRYTSSAGAASIGDADFSTQTMADGTMSLVNDTNTGQVSLHARAGSSTHTRIHGNPNYVVRTVSAGATLTITDVTVATLHQITLTANSTFTFPTAAAGKRCRLVLIQDATGSRTVTWPGTVKWPGGVAPTLTVTAGKIDVIDFTCVDGTNWLGNVVGQNY